MVSSCHPGACGAREHASTAEARAPGTLPPPPDTISAGLEYTTSHPHTQHIPPVRRSKKKAHPDLKRDTDKNYSTSYSRVISHRSTDDAITSLTSEIGRDPVLSGVYGRS